MKITYTHKKTAEGGIKGGGKISYNAQIVYSGTMSVTDFVELFRQNARLESYSEAEKYYDILQATCIECLQKGKIVPLSLMGQIYPKIKSKRVESEDKVNLSSIIRLDAYLATNRFFKKEMRKVKLAKKRKRRRKIILEL